MRRVFWSAVALLPVTAAAAYDQRPGSSTNRAYVFQSGGGEDTATTKITRGEGFVIIEQHSHGNHALVIQSR